MKNNYILLPLVLLTLAIRVDAASFHGKVVLNDGSPAMGAMVSVSAEDNKQRQTVYTARDGSYAIVTPYAGKLLVRARLANFADASETMDATLDSRQPLTLTLTPFASKKEATEALAASAHNAELAWTEASHRRAFISQCNYCHQMGNATTRIPRSHDAWLSTIGRMEGYLAMVSKQEAEIFAKVFAEGFRGQTLDTRLDYGADDDSVQAKIEEWQVGEATSFVHDMDIAADGLFYGTDEGHDMLRVLNPQDGSVVNYPLPKTGLPLGGVFSGMQLPIGIFTGEHGPHSMAQTTDGRIWITNALSSTLASFDPKTKQYKLYPVPNDALYPHTIRVDKNDVLWFTLVASNQVGRFDPKTESMTVFRLPHNGFFRWVSDMLLPTLLRIASWFPDQGLLMDFSHHRFLGYEVLAFPYGIDINPQDGSVWYAKLYASKIGRIDPKTLEITEYDTPLKGPRRPRFDAQGIFWIPAFNDGALMRFDPKTAQFESFPMPPVAKGEYETPYALNVEPKSGDVWLAANNSDRILRFSPTSKTFTSYASPTRVTVFRDFSFTKDGRVCSAQSNLPAWAIEGGLPSYFCLAPKGGAADRQALSY